VPELLELLDDEELLLDEELEDEELEELLLDEDDELLEDEELDELLDEPVHIDPQPPAESQPPEQLPELHEHGQFCG
jgi:hypothetical protein